MHYPSLFLLSLSLVQAACVQKLVSCNASMNHFPFMPEFKYASTIKNLQNKNSWISFDLVHAGILDPTPVTHSYAFVRCGCPAPTGLVANTTVIEVPVSKVMIQDTVTVPKITLIGQGSAIDLVEDSTFITTRSVRTALFAGSVTDVQFDYTKVNAALPDVIVTDPGMLMSLNGTSMIPNPTWYNQSFTQILESRRLMETDASEKTPLGRAELIKLYGLLFGISESANSVFTAIEQNYMSARAAAQKLTRRRPSVIKGFPFGGNWTLVSNDTYFARYLSDAGADFLNSELFTSRILPSEPFSEFFNQADVWIDALEFAPDGSKMTEDRLFTGNETETAGGDAMYFEKFVAAQCDNLYANDARVVSTGNAFYEEGVVRPDLILWDLVQILHPASFSNPDLYFYRRLEDTQNSTILSSLPKCPLAKLPYLPVGDNSYISRTFTVSGTNPALYHNAIPSLIKPKIAELTGASSDNLAVFLLNSDRPNNMTFDVQIMINAEPDRVSSFASSLEKTDDISRILSSSLSTYLDQKKSSISYFQSPPSSSVTINPGSSVAILRADGSQTEYNPNAGKLSSGAIAGIVIGSLVGVALIAALTAWLAYRSGKRHAYEQIKAEECAKEELKEDLKVQDSLETMVAL